MIIEWWENWKFDNAGHSDVLKLPKRLKIIDCDHGDDAIDYDDDKDDNHKEIDASKEEIELGTKGGDEPQSGYNCQVSSFSSSSS